MSGFLSTTYGIGGAVIFLVIACIGRAITIDVLPDTAAGSDVRSSSWRDNFRDNLV